MFVVELFVGDIASRKEGYSLVTWLWIGIVWGLPSALTN